MTITEEDMGSCINLQDSGIGHANIQEQAKILPRSSHIDYRKCPPATRPCLSRADNPFRT